MEAAKIIWDCWQNGKKIKQLPKKISPKNRSESYAIQSLYEKFSGKPIFGWKIAATSLDGQKHIGVSGPLVGRILHDRVFSPNEKLNFGGNKMAVAEPEFAFRMGTTLEPKNTKYTIEEVMNSVDTLHPSIEIPDSRFENFALVGENQLIADNACAHEFVIGPAMSKKWKLIDLSKHIVKISVLNGMTNEGVGSNVLGDPKIALTWLVNELSQNNITLFKGMIVSTGTCAKPIKIQKGDKITVDYGFLGTLSTSFN
jgi:2-keto-4-pentenoate hydratase